MTQSRTPSEIDKLYLPHFIQDIKELLEHKSFKNDSNPWLRILNDITKKSSGNIKLLDDALFSILHFNQSEIISFLLKKNPHYFSYLKKINLTKFNSHFTGKYIFYYLIERDAIETLDALINVGWKYKYKHLIAAVKANANISASYFLKKITFTEEQRFKLANIAKSQGNLRIINELLPKDPLFYFGDICKKLNNEEKINTNEVFYHISQAYRYSNMNSVETLCKNFLQHLKERYSNPKHEKNSNLLIEEINKARTSFPEWASQIAQYTKPSDLRGLEAQYRTKTSKIEAEVTLGQTHFDYIKKLYEDKAYRDSQLEKLNALDSKEEINTCKLPIVNNVSTKFISMRDFVRLIVRYRSNHAHENKEKKATAFNQFKTNTFESNTSCHLSRYDHMLPFAGEMLKKHENPDYHNSYLTFFKNLKMTLFDYNFTSIGEGYQLRPCWIHGLKMSHQNIIWPEVENIHKELLEMDAKKIEQNPKRFYELVVAGIWLIGNLTLVERGTGRIVEAWLAFIHYYHKLPIPVLKKGFQLDCMNLTFDLLTYQQLFFNFFEPASLMKSALTLKEKNNQIPEIADYLKLFDYFKAPEKRKLLMKTNTLFAKKKPVQDSETPTKEHLTCRFSPSFQAQQL
jgi:hypothetical protein